MNAKQKMLFGIHDFKSAHQSLAVAGALLKKKKNLEITLFHGAPDPNLSMLTKILRMTPQAVEEYQKKCS